MEINTVLYMPDGNRRFARKTGLSLTEAYLIGGKTLKLFSDFFVAGGIANKLIYHAMSDYTYRRTDLSLESIYSALERIFEQLTEERFFEKNNIAFRAIDHSGKLPQKIKKKVKNLSHSINDTKEKEVVMLLGYSLEEDINQALLQNPQDYQTFRKNLIFPDIDLVIRPHEMRLSGGPVYAMAQAQMITLDKLNPEVKREDLELAVKEYSRLRDYRSDKSFNPHHKLSKNLRRKVK